MIATSLGIKNALFETAQADRVLTCRHLFSEKASMSMNFCHPGRKSSLGARDPVDSFQFY